MASVRDTQFASWYDQDAWMEKMKGAKWNAVLKEEETLVHHYTNLPAVKERIKKYESYYKEDTSSPILFYHGLVKVRWQNKFFKIWSFINSTTAHECRDVLITPSAVYTVVDIKDREEYFELQCWKDPYDTKPAWKISPVGPDITIQGSTLYYLGVKNKLIYYKLMSCDLNGKNIKTLYQEPEFEVNLAIHRLADEQSLFSRENSQNYEYYDIPTMNSISDKYRIPSSWISPLGEYGIDWLWPQHGFLITKQHGQKVFWKCSDRSSKKLLTISAGEILVDPYAVWSSTSSLPCLVEVSEPTGTSYYTLNENSLTLIEKPKTTLKTARIKGISKDGKQVYGIVVYKGIPKHILAIGYGAYGMPSATGPVLTRWGPLVESGWCILYTFLRGGGDHTDAWAKAGRVKGRMNTIYDFEALVYSTQDIFRIEPSNTIIYGRSAGGLLMGGTLANHPNGTLMSGVYAEVPYVDELRTTTNPGLPLTVLEYNEFGDPIHKLIDFLSVGLLSPADTAMSLRCPSIFVLSRTAENDSQVFTYEPVKWIRRLRKKLEAPKLCIIEKGQGHFTPPDIQSKQWAVDCALLDAWIHRELR